MRSTYGKLMYMLQDTQNRIIQVRRSSPTHQPNPPQPTQPPFHSNR